MGVNGISLSNVNACSDANLQLLSDESVSAIIKNVRPILERWQITSYWTVCYAAPKHFAGLDCDPLDPRVRSWWDKKLRQIAAQNLDFVVGVVPPINIVVAGGLQQQQPEQQQQQPNHSATTTTTLQQQQLLFNNNKNVFFWHSNNNN